MRRRGGSGGGQLWLGVLVAVLAVAGIGYLLLGELQESGQGVTPAATPTPPPTAGAKPARTEDGTRTKGRSDTILTCTADDGQVYYTNATRCEDADLGNRVNVIETPSLPASKPEGCLGAQPGGPRTQLFLPICQEPFNQALELEPFLLESDDPQSSRAARRYCAFITEGVQAGCMATSDQFCFLHLCQALREQEGS
jgi:hypothetical protein